MKKAIAIFLLISLSLALVGCSGTRREGFLELTFDLPWNYREYDSEGVYDKAYSYGGIIIGILRLSFDSCLRDHIPITLSPEGLARFYMTELIDLPEEEEIISRGDIPYFSYIIYEGGVSYRYVPHFFASPDAYFIVSLVLRDESYLAYAEDLHNIIDTARLSPAR